MMCTLLLRLAGPMQSWGTSSKFNTRGTGPEPSKSAIVGIMAAALGRKRGDPINDLASLRVGVRADREGSLERDLQIVRPDFPGKKANEKSYVTYRYYLSDAVFLAGIESPDRDFLEQIEYALRHPAYHLYLGRKSYPVTLPLVIGIRDKGLMEALKEEPGLTEGDNVRIVADSADSFDTITKDQPLSFKEGKRRYGSRFTKEAVMKIPAGPKGPESRDHDAFAQLEQDSPDHDAFSEI